MNSQVTICLHSGRGLIQRLIRWFTHSKYSHVSLLLPDGRHAEAREFRGVITHGVFSPKRHEIVDCLVLAQPLTVDELARLETFIRETQGERYDYVALLGFIIGFRRAQPSPTRWICSEWVYAAFLAAGRQLLRSTDSWTIDPHEIGLSPLLTQPNRL